MSWKVTEETLAEWFKEGRGQGRGPDYKPWLTVQNISSDGRCHRLPTPSRFGRSLHLLSDIEKKVFLIVERCRHVSEALEQCPIERALSQRVAQDMGIRHPTYPGTNVPFVMTVDLLVTVERPSGRMKIGIDSKSKSHAEDPRVIEKLQLSRACLEHQGYRHLVVFDSQLPKQLVKNLDLIRTGRQNEVEVPPYPNYLEEMTDRLHRHLPTMLFGKRSLRAVCEEFDQITGQPRGTGQRAARRLIDSHILHVDLHRENIEDLPMHAFSLVDQKSVGVILGAA